MAEELKPEIICFGEILWDNLPGGRTAGGAPMNVAYHLNRTGADSKLISRTGNDTAGSDLIAFLQQIQLPADLIQTDHQYATGEVMATVTENDEVVYDIKLNAAWDFIEFKPEYRLLAKEADAFVFGSLSARNETTRNTLLQILETASFKVFDVNLRAPHYSKEILELLLSKTDLLKLNENELLLLGEWFYEKGGAEQETAKFLLGHFGIEEIVITKGAEGASYYTGDTYFTGTAYPVTVADTVGAGDSFLAAFLHKKLTGSAIPEALDYALGLGAFIAGKHGACPPYTKEELEAFMHQSVKNS